MSGRNRRTAVGRPPGSVTRWRSALPVPSWHVAKMRIAPKLGRAIQAERELRSVSAEEVAGRLGLCKGTIMKWERGDACPTIADLVRVAWALGCRVDALLEDM
jgi:ribosome-binding protein aMBF1 (putative translation factor)